MKKEEFIRQRMENDKVTRKYFDKNYIVIECTCNKSYCNGWRCLTESDINDVDLFNYIKKITNEKQQLIYFLKNKIKEIDKTIPSDLICAISMRSDKLAELNAYQTILDFVNKGGKE